MKPMECAEIHALPYKYNVRLHGKTFWLLLKTSTIFPTDKNPYDAHAHTLYSSRQDATAILEQIKKKCWK